MEAIELSLDEDGQEAFLRLQKALPSCARDLVGLAESLAGLGEGLVVAGDDAVAKLDVDATLDEVAEDLDCLSKRVLDPVEADRFGAARDAVLKHQAWRETRLPIVFAKATGKESTGVYLRLPPSIARQFPDKSADDPSPPHVTLCYVGDCDADEFARVVRAVQSVASLVEPFRVDVHDYGEFENPEGKTIAHAIPRAHGPTSLEQLHVQIRKAIERELGRDTEHRPGPFKAHSTLAYVDKGQKYEGPKPKGTFKARRVEVWGNRGGAFGRVPIALGTGDLGMRRSSGEPVAKDDGQGDLSTGDLRSTGGALVAAQGASAYRRRRAPEFEYVDPWKNLEHEKRAPESFAVPQNEVEKAWSDEARAAAAEARPGHAEAVSRHLAAREGAPAPRTHDGPTGPTVVADGATHEPAKEALVARGFVSSGKATNRTGEPYREGDDARQEKFRHPDGTTAALRSLRDQSGPSSSVEFGSPRNPPTTKSADTHIGARAYEGPSAKRPREHQSSDAHCSCDGVPCSCDAGKPEGARAGVAATVPPRDAADSVFRDLQMRDDELEKREVRFCPVSKAATDERTVLGIVLEPEVVDAQKDIYSADEIRNTAWRFMEKYQRFGLMHEGDVPELLPLESYLAPVDFEVGGQKVKKGSWVLRLRVRDESIWQDIKSGKLTGFSIGGSAVRTPVRAA